MSEFHIDESFKLKTIDICSSYQKDTEECRFGCNQIKIYPKQYCPYEYETYESIAKMQNKCPCYTH